MSVTQATISKYESSEPTVSTMRRYVEALQGQLEVVAVFAEGKTILGDDLETEQHGIDPDRDALPAIPIAPIPPDPASALSAS